jgi:hypothetical protein
MTCVYTPVEVGKSAHDGGGPRVVVGPGPHRARSPNGTPPLSIGPRRHLQAASRLASALRSGSREAGLPGLRVAAVPACRRGRVVGSGP